MANHWACDKDSKCLKYIKVTFKKSIYVWQKILRRKNPNARPLKISGYQIKNNWSENYFQKKKTNSKIVEKSNHFCRTFRKFWIETFD